MEILIKSIIGAHVLAGITTLIAGPFAILFNFKNIRNHRIAGKIFAFAMTISCFTGFIGVLRYPEKIFFQFLALISVIVLIGMSRGVRAISLMKHDRVSAFDWAYTAVLAVTGIGMIGRGLFLYAAGVNLAFPILFTVFGIGALSDVVKNYKNFKAYTTLTPTDWMAIHLQSMIGAFIASTTAFTVNVAHGLPWFIQWFGPTILLVPVILYFTKKVKAIALRTVSEI